MLAHCKIVASRLWYVSIESARRKAVEHDAASLPSNTLIARRSIRIIADYRLLDGKPTVVLWNYHSISLYGQAATEDNYSGVFGSANWMLHSRGRVW